MKKILFAILISLFPVMLSAQEKNDSVQTPEIVNTATREGLDSLSIDYLTMKNPMRASLYSAILPGMGQVYNGKWWKVPIVWGLLGTGAGFIVHYNNEYKDFRGFYLDKLYGNPISDPAINNLTVEQLANLQDDRKRSRDYAIALTALVYILNIIDATVDAHLYGINKDPDLSFQPIMLQQENSFEPKLGLGINYKF
jgi:hypothetical protein